MLSQVKEKYCMELSTWWYWVALVSGLPLFRWSDFMDDKELDISFASSVLSSKEGHKCTFLVRGRA